MSEEIRRRRADREIQELLGQVRELVDVQRSIREAQTIAVGRQDTEDQDHRAIYDELRHNRELIEEIKRRLGHIPEDLHLEQHEWISDQMQAARDRRQFWRKVAEGAATYVARRAVIGLVILLLAAALYGLGAHQLAWSWLTQMNQGNP